MIPKLTTLKLDFGTPQFEHLSSQCNFPWLLANVFESNGSILGNCQPTHIVSSNGIKIGLIGIAEEEWLATVNALPPDLHFVSASETVNKLSLQLRSQGADLIIALCHQREVNDNRLANETHDLDLILGGHDHQYRHSEINGTHVLCSGTDFKQLSYLEARRRPPSPEGKRGWDFTITRRDITSPLPSDPETVARVSKLSSGLGAKLDKPLGFTAAALDSRFTTVRKAESNLGNLVADVLRNYYGGDCAIIVGGTFRGDQVYPPGVLKLRDIMDCLPFEDPTVMVRAKGGAIRDALENAVSTWPALEGRFPQVSGIRFVFDPSKKPRVQSVSIGDEPLEVGREYKLVTRHYTTQGGDGFGSLKAKGEDDYLVNDENGQLISQLLRQYFMSLRVMGKWKRWSEHLGHHWGEVGVGVHAVHPVREARRRKTGEGLAKEKKGEGEGEERNDHPGLSDSEDDEAHAPPVSPTAGQKQSELDLMRRVTRKWWRLAGITGHPGLCEEADEGFAVHWTQGICPRVEGRIQIIGVKG